MRKLVGVVLCGGKSTRMGIDKSTIVYHGKPQWLHMVTILLPMCDEVLVSCRNEQADEFNRSLADLGRVSVCIDKESVAGQGPMSGVISAFEQFPESALLVTGCDYPLLGAEDLQPLINARSTKSAAVCYHLKAESLDIPFPAVYEPAMIGPLKKLFAGGNFSLRTALESEPTVRLDPPNPDHLMSANSPDEVNWMKERIAQQSRNI